MSEDRFQRGLERLREVDGASGEQVVRSFEDIAPDLGRYILEFAFGDIYNRPELDLKQRELITIASLATNGGSEPQLHVHINASLHVGLTPQEIIEAFLQLIPYTGFPRVINAVNVARKVFEENGLMDELKAK